MAKKFSDEELLRFKQAGFSAEEISLFQHNPEYAPTEEEFVAIETTNTIAEAVSALPSNREEFLDMIEKTYGLAFEKAKSQKELEQMFLQLAKKNPKFAAQVATYFQLIDLVAE